MAEIRDTTFKRQDVDVDGVLFVGCIFEQCDLIFRGKELFGMDRCILNGSRFKFEDSAALTLAALRQMYLGGFAPLVEDTVRSLTAPADERADK